MLDTLGQLLNYYSTGLILLPVALIVTAYWSKDTQHWLLLWGSFLIMQACVWTLKFITTIQRPIGNHALVSPSFPSGVAADAGFFAAYLSIKYPKHWIIWHCLGIGIALLRVYIGAHYIFDIAAGYLIGVIIFLLTNKLIRFQTSANSVQTAHWPQNWIRWWR